MIRLIIDNSPTLSKYKETMRQCIHLYYPQLYDEDINKVIDYSIEKRFTDSKSSINNSYTKTEKEYTLLRIADYINSREPIVTAMGTMFKKHADCPNPLFETVQSFLDLRGIHKKQMFQFPKGSEDFERYNLMQQLDKIDANGKIIMP